MKIILLQKSTLCLLFLSTILAAKCTNGAQKANPATLASNYLLFNSAADLEAHLNTNNRAESSIADVEDKIKSLVTNSSHYHMDDNVSIELANAVWRRMSANAALFASKRVNETSQVIGEFLRAANVSNKCKLALNLALHHLGELDAWAVKMWNSFGDFPPAGLFEGTFNSMGSYHQCLYHVEPNEYIGEPQQCVLKYQPVLPKRPRYHHLLASVENLANFSSPQKAIGKLAQKSHYFYYLNLRFSTCLPTKCSQEDVEKIGKQVALNTYFQYIGSQCFQRKSGSLKLELSEIVAISILLSLASLTLFGTLVHILSLKSLLRKSSSSTLINKQNNNNNNNYPFAKLNGNDTQTNADKSRMLLLSNVGSSSANHRQSNEDKVSQQTDNNTECCGAVFAEALQLKPCASYYPKLDSLIEFALHFSIIKNFKKLIDTSTSRNGNSSFASMEAKIKQEQRSLRAREKVQKSASSTSKYQQQDPLFNHETTTNNQQLPGRDISCVHGLRFWTISWIIFGHTMQYTEWAGNGRAFEVESSLTSLALQPLLSASYSVDTFFLISGLLTTYVTWSISHGQYRRFNKFAFLISRYLRLTPQVLLVIGIYIILPLAGEGPFWQGAIKRESDNCKAQWWLNALYLQAFVNSANICNIVTWWLSIEMFYHFVSIFVIIALFKSTKRGLYVATIFGGSLTCVSYYLHYINAYPPGLLPTQLQKYEVWDGLILSYFWTPYPHAASYFVGLLVGYVLYTQKITLITKPQRTIGWTFFVLSYSFALFGNYYWNQDGIYTALGASLFYNTANIVWALATGWLILACSLGYGGWLNEFLSAPIFIPLGRAVYMTYLSHMIIVMMYPASMNMLLEPTKLVLTYVFLSNWMLSYAFGVALTLIYESPILHLQKLMVAKLAGKYNKAMDAKYNVTSSTSSSPKLSPNQNGSIGSKLKYKPDNSNESGLCKVSLSSSSNELRSSGHISNDNNNQDEEIESLFMSTTNIAEKNNNNC